MTCFHSYQTLVGSYNIAAAKNDPVRFGFVAVLLAFGILREELVPVRCKEDAGVVAGCLGRCGDVGRHGEAQRVR